MSLYLAMTGDKDVERMLREAAAETMSAMEANKRHKKKSVTCADGAREHGVKQAVVTPAAISITATLTCFSLSVLTMHSKCDSDRLNRSSFQTTRTSPGRTNVSAWFSPNRSSLAPEA